MVVVDFAAFCDVTRGNDTLKVSSDIKPPAGSHVFIHFLQSTKLELDVFQCKVRMEC